MKKKSRRGSEKGFGEREKGRAVFLEVEGGIGEEVEGREKERVSCRGS